jgi:glycosyltransferase involved in cell wall biosynthesis
VCYVRHSYYMNTAHLHRNVQALGRAGFSVSVVVLRAAGQPAHERLMPGVDVYRLPVQHHRGGVARYLWEYCLFAALAFLLVTALHVRKRFDFVEVDNMPDALVLCALVPKLTGARIILYIADCMADLMVGSKGRSPRHPLVRLMRAEELASAAFADCVIVPNLSTRRRLTSGGIPEDKITTVLNCPDDEQSFIRRPRQAWDSRSGRLRIVTHGTLVERYGIQVLIDALPKLLQTLPHVTVDIFGDGEFRRELEARCQRNGVTDRVRFWGFVPQRDLPAALAEADIAYAGPLVDLLVANKMFEYQALGIPMVMARWPALEDYFPDDCVSYFRAGDAEDLARVILDLHRDANSATAQAERAWTLYDRRYRWAIQRDIFLGLYRECSYVALSPVCGHAEPRRLCSGCGPDD